MVVPQLSENSSKVRERQLVRFQESLLCRMQVRPVKGCPACHAPHREHLQLRAFASQIAVRLVPIDLRLRTPRIALRNAHFSHQQTEGGPPSMYVLTDGPLGNLTRGQLVLNSDPVAVSNPLDYGCYVDLLTTVKAPLGLLPGIDDGSYTAVPDDDYRAIRLAIWIYQLFEAQLDSFDVSEVRNR